MTLFLATTALFHLLPSDTACSIAASSFQSMGTPIIGQSGNAIFDSSLTNDIVELKKVTGLRFAFWLYQENEGYNAFASKEVDEELLQKSNISRAVAADGSMMFGVNLINRLYQANTSFAIPSILGHEVGHLMQFKTGLSYKKGMYNELQADYLAGWFTAHRARFLQQNLLQSWKGMYDLGDSDFFSPQHHGTPTERASAFSAGVDFNFRSNTPDYSLAFKASRAYIDSIGGQ